MSSKFIPPNVGAIFLIVWIISSVFFVFKTIGTAFTPPNFLKRMDFPSITGRAASGPISPSPSTAVPSDITAIEFPFHVYSYAKSLSFAISLQGSATPGVYARPRSSFESIFALDSTLSFPFQFLWASKALS